MSDIPSQEADERDVSGANAGGDDMSVTSGTFSSSTATTVRASPMGTLAALPSTSAFHSNVPRSKSQRSSGRRKTLDKNGTLSGSNQAPPLPSVPSTSTPTSTPTTQSAPRPRIRNTPHLPHGPAEPAPPTIMYWSKAPVWGSLPTRNMRAHTITLVDNIAWVYGGCDDRNCWKDVWCFDVETFQWSHPEMLGDLPPPCRAHTATLVDRKIFVFGGGEGPTYFNTLYILDTVTRRWLNVKITTGPIPLPRRAHTTVVNKGKLIVFGGGTGEKPLNDVWSLDISVPPEKMKWEEVITKGVPPSPRGYHTANLVEYLMIVIGGSDGRGSFSDVWLLNMDSLEWQEICTERVYQRLAHSSTQVGSYLFIMGGHDGARYLNDLLLFNLVTLQYEPRSTLGKPPAPRGYHAAILADSRLFTFGGFDGHAVFDDVYILDLAASAYLPQVTSFHMMVDY